MTRSGLFFSLIFAFAPLFHAAAEGLTRLDPGLYAISTEIETSLQDPGTGTLLETWTDPFGGAVCLEGEDARQIHPDSFIDTRCHVSNVRVDPYGEAFDLFCVFPEGLLSGSGTLAVDRTWPTEFLQRFTLRSPGPVASQRVTIRGRLAGDCLPADLAAGP
nr:hypothetical protein [uncultured Hyphomonas sp.]